jgi:hypothetical protein
MTKKALIGLVMVLCLAMVAPAAMAQVSLCPDGSRPTPFQFTAYGVTYWNLCGFIIKAENVTATLYVNGAACAAVYTAADGSYTVSCSKVCVNGGRFYNETFTFYVKLDFASATLPTDQSFTSSTSTVYPYCCCFCCFQKYQKAFNATANTCVGIL